MTKYAVLGDTHFGCRNDSAAFHDNFAKFYTETFFPYLKEHGIQTIIQTGDLFDRRKFINFASLTRAREYFFDALHEHGLYMITYLGNHDVYYKNTLDVNSPSLLLRDYEESVNLEIITRPTMMKIGSSDTEISVDWFPWICADNEADTKRIVATSDAQICFGHFEFTGFEMDAGNPCLVGMDRNDFKKYEMVISGHFHHRSSDGHVFYVGSPYEMTWADYDDPRGFHIFDTADRSLTFIENPHKMFYKIEYDDTNETIETIDNKDYSEFKNKYVKVVVKKKNSFMLFDRFINNFYEAAPADLGVVEDFTDYKLAESIIEGIDQAEHTHTLLDKYVDTVDMELDKTKMKSVMRQIYNQAQTE